jgi:hypothetical protein
MRALKAFEHDFVKYAFCTAQIALDNIRAEMLHVQSPEDMDELVAAVELLEMAQDRLQVMHPGSMEVTELVTMHAASAAAEMLHYDTLSKEATKDFSAGEGA